MAFIRPRPRAILLFGTLALAGCPPVSGTGDGGGLDAGSGMDAAADTLPAPLQVMLSSPDGTVYTHGVVTVQVVVLGGTPDSVDLLRDGTPLAAALPAPYQYAWDTSSVAEGSYQITARANRGGQSFESVPRTVVVDRTRPTVTARAPAPGSAGVSVHAPITATFSEPMLPGSVNAGSVSLTASTGGSVAHTASLSADGTTLTVAATAAVTIPNSLTAAFTEAITDLAGNPLLVPSDAWSWDLPAWLSADAGLPPTANNAYSPKLAVNADGALYAAWVEGATSRVAVARWNDSAWEPAGAPFAAPGATTVDAPSIAVDAAGVPTVAFQQLEGSGSTSQTDVWVMQYTAGAWAPLGTAINTYATTPALTPALALDAAGAPVVAWRDSLSSFVFVGAVRWSGTAWADLMSPLNDPAAASPALFPAVAAGPDGSVVVAFSQAGATASDVIVRRYDGASWTTLGGPLSGASGATSATAVDVAANATAGAYVAWTEPAAAGGDAQVFVQRWTGGGFMALGAGLDGDPQAGTPALSPAVRLDATGAPVLAWAEGLHVFVRRWSGTAWEAVGGGAIPAAQAGDAVTAVSLTVPPGGVPLVLWAESGGAESALHARVLNQ